MLFLKYLFVVLSVGLISFEIYKLIMGKNDMFNYTKHLWKLFKWNIFFKCILLIVTTLALVYLISYIPFLDKGWYGYIFGSNKNITLAVIDVESESPFKILLSVPFLIALIFLIPSFSQAEETIFRKNKLSRKKRLIASVKFGLMHCLMGISPAAGIALILPGYYFSTIYKKGYDKAALKGFSSEDSHEKALELSTLYHSVYNTILIASLIILICILAVLFSMLSKNQ